MAIYKSKKATKDGRQYFFRIKYKDVFGYTHDYTSQKFKMRNEAIDAETDFKIKIRSESLSSSNITFKQLFRDFIRMKENEIKKQTIIKLECIYKNHLSVLNDVKVNNFDFKMLRKIEDDIRSKNFSTIHSNKIIELLVSLLKYSNKYYNTSIEVLKYVNKFKDVNKEKEDISFFTYDEYLLFDKAIDNFDYHVFFEILYFLGLRQGEAQALTWNDIDLENNNIKIKKTLTTKLKDEKWTISTPKTKNSIRILPLTEKLSNDLKIMYNTALKYSDYKKDWFVFGNTLPYTEATIRNKKNILRPC